MVLASGMVRASPADRSLDVYWIDSEGGGSTLIVTPAGQSVLIDAGNPGDRDAGRIHDVAVKAGLTKIDFLLTTHFHRDHFGGAASLAALMPIGQVYNNGIPDHDPDHQPNGDAIYLQAIRPYREFKADGRNLVHAGLILPLDQTMGAGRLEMLCVAAKQQFIPAPAGASANPLAGENTVHSLPPTDNDNSSAWLISFGPFRMWDGGDLTWNMEAKVVLPANRVGQVDVYQVDHHGLAFSNNPVLIHSLAPTVSVMNDGPLKGTMTSTIAGLTSSPGIQAMYQVHKNLRPEDPQDNTSDAYIANFDRDPNHKVANDIEMKVAPDGLTYTIGIPATGADHTYHTRPRP